MNKVTTTTSNTPGDSLSDNKGGTGSVADTLAKTAHEAIDRASEKAAVAEQNIRQTAAQTEVRAREMGAQAQLTSEQTLQTVQNYMRTHPLESLGIAFVSGLIVSSVLRK